jgi:hypothetical protein
VVEAEILMEVEGGDHQEEEAHLMTVEVEEPSNLEVVVEVRNRH